MNQEPKPGFHQQEASAGSIKVSGEDKTEQNPVTSLRPSRKECVVENIKAGMNIEADDSKGTNLDAGEAFIEENKKAPSQKQSSQQREDVEPTDLTLEENAKVNILEDAETFGDDDSAKGDCLDTMEKTSGQKGNDESQNNVFKIKKSTDAELENVGYSLKRDKKRIPQGENEQQADSKQEPSENDTTPAEHPSQSLTSDEDLAKRDCILTKDKKPGQQVTEANKAAADEHFCPTAKTGVKRTSRVSEAEPPNTIKTEKLKKKETGPATTQSGVLGGGIKLLVAVVIVALVAMLVQHLLQSKSPPHRTDWQQIDVFLKQMEKVKAKFSNQRPELWTRSKIHLKRHLQTSHPAEPVSLILASGLRAERTMRCLAQDLASAFASAHNASVLHIEGAGKAGQDSDQVKLDIDKKLQEAFEGDKPVAVIHRLDDLPPGSTLIFYRYCDHENAAYKRTFLIFTVLLGDEEEIPTEMRLNILEEMVDDYLQKKFLSHSHPVSFDRMDIDKYGGLWSRISHLILPVAAEKSVEHEGC